LCYKGGTTPDAWVLPESKLYKFQAQVYIESEPKGRVIRLQ
jgi:AMMECR1 domain-containing protein